MPHRTSRWVVAIVATTACAATASVALVRPALAESTPTARSATRAVAGARGAAAAAAASRRNPAVQTAGAATRDAVVTTRRVSAAATRLAAVATGAGAAQAARVLSLGLSVPVSTVTAQANWILEAQLPNGALGNYPHSSYIDPYLANYAAMGLARASEVTGDPTYAQAAWAWLDWYASHEGANGYVTTYHVLNGADVSTGTYDSTDAYAGTFLAAAGDTFAADPDLGNLRAIAAGITGAVGAIESTQHADGLTGAAPNWQVAYLMDESEVYGGLTAVPALAGALGDPALAARATADATALYNGVQGLWNPSTGAYDWAQDTDGYLNPVNWSIFYPDVAEDAWALAYGLVPADRAAALAARISAAAPYWATPTATANELDGGTVISSAIGYFPTIAWGLQQGGEAAAASNGAASIYAAAQQANLDWPYTPSDAGQLIVAESGGPAVSVATTMVSSGSDTPAPSGTPAPSAAPSAAPSSAAVAAAGAPLGAPATFAPTVRPVLSTGALLAARALGSGPSMSMLVRRAGLRSTLGALRG